MRRHKLNRLDHPLYLFIAIILLHVCGRVGAFCSDARVDSVLYAYSSYFFYQPGASIDMVVADKPMGLYALVGVSYLLLPQSPSRLTLVPIESLFMLAGYACFWLLARRLHGSRSAWILTLAAVISVNLLNVFDTGTDGFNLAENYLWFPMLLAVYAVLFIDQPARSGLLAGIGVGLACSFKQTAATLALVVALVLLLQARDPSQRPAVRRRWPWLAAGIAVVWIPLMISLLARGWLLENLRLMVSLPGRHASWPQFNWPDRYELLPFLWAGWWLALGGLLRLPGSSMRVERVAAERNHATAALLCWCGLEAAIVATLKIPSSHYFQILVLPLLLLSGYALNHVRAVIKQCAFRQRYRMALPLAVASVCILIYSALPLISAARTRWPFFDATREARDFGRTISEVSSRAAGSDQDS